MLAESRQEDGIQRRDGHVRKPKALGISFQRRAATLATRATCIHGIQRDRPSFPLPPPPTPHYGGSVLLFLLVGVIARTVFRGVPLSFDKSFSFAGLGIYGRFEIILYGFAVSVSVLCVGLQPIAEADPTLRELFSEF